MNTDFPKIYAGIDGGGTKTKAVIADAAGQVLGQGQAGGANFHNAPLELCLENIHQALLEAFSNAFGNALTNLYSFESVCLALAGLDSPEEKQHFSQYLQNYPRGHRLFQAKRYVLCNDGYAGLNTVTDESVGVCLIASTGSNCYGINNEGIEAKAGGWGYLLGDQGSAYVIGIKILKQVMQEYDGRLPQSRLTQAVFKQLQIQKHDELIAMVYGGQLSVVGIAALSQLISNPELSEDQLLQTYLNESVVALVQSYEAVINRLMLKDQIFPVALVGGLFKVGEKFVKEVERGINQITPQAQVKLADMSPAEAAVKVALINPQSLPLNILTITANS